MGSGAPDYGSRIGATHPSSDWARGGSLARWRHSVAWKIAFTGGSAFRSRRPPSTPPAHRGPSPVLLSRVGILPALGLNSFLPLDTRRGGARVGPVSGLDRQFSRFRRASAKTFS